MSEFNKGALSPGNEKDMQEVEEKAAQAALRLVHIDQEPHDKVLNGIIEMGAHYSPMVEEDINIAKLESGLFVLSHMRNFRVTRIDAYIGSYLGQVYGSAAGIASEKAKAEIARAYSAVGLLRKAFNLAQSQEGLDKAKLTEFMTRETPSKFWQKQSATKVAIDNIVESYEVAKSIAGGLEEPVSVDELMGQLEDTYRKQGLGIEDLPPGASELEQRRWRNQINGLVNQGWANWLEDAQLANEPVGNPDLSS
jgi:hypothetical protein